MIEPTDQTHNEVADAQDSIGETGRRCDTDNVQDGIFFVKYTIKNYRIFFIGIL